MRRIWAETMFERVYSAASAPTEPDAPTDPPAETDTPAATDAPAAVVYGDVNADKSITAADVVALQQYLLGRLTLTDTSMADMDGDGVVDVFDLGLLKRMVIQGGKLG